MLTYVHTERYIYSFTFNPKNMALLDPVLKPHNYLLSSTCQAIKRHGRQKTGTKSVKSWTKSGTQLSLSPCFAQLVFHLVWPDTNLLICRAANLVDICKRGEGWMCTTPRIEDLKLTTQPINHNLSTYFL